MGVPGLWHELADAGIDCTLAELAWEHWSTNETPQRLFRVGIDATLWLYHARKAQGGKNPALRSLFFRLARLLKLPILPIFVLDGAERPKLKRDTVVYTGAHAIQAQFCAMLDAFHYAYWTAPAEAEAELAWMNRAGFIDAVLTDDVDALLFGAQVVVRNRAWRDDADDDDVDTAAVYDIRKGTWLIDADGMVLVAILSGADYDTQGMFRCGVKVGQSTHTDGPWLGPRWFGNTSARYIPAHISQGDRCRYSIEGMGTISWAMACRCLCRTCDEC